MKPVSKLAKQVNEPRAATVGISPLAIGALRDNRPVAQRQLQQQQRIANSPRQLAQLRAVAPVQRVKVAGNTYKSPGAKNTKELLVGIKKHTVGATLVRGWQKHFKENILKSIAKDFPDQDALIQELVAVGFGAKLKSAGKQKVRPGFPSESPELGKITLGLQTGKDQSAFSPLGNDAALPHRFSFADIMGSTERFINGQEQEADLRRWSDRLKVATEQRRDANEKALTAKGDTTESAFVVMKADLQLHNFEQYRAALIAAVAAKKPLDLYSTETQNFLRVTNGLYGNIPDYGPHNTINNPVSNRLHMHFESGELTPGSIAAASMTPTRIGKGLAMTVDGQHIVTTDGRAVAYKSLSAKDKALLDRHVKSPTSITTSAAVGHNF